MGIRNNELRKMQNRKPTEDLFMPDKNTEVKNDLKILKGRGASLIDKMLACDFNFDEDIHLAYDLAQNYKAKIDEFCRKHLKQKTNPKVEKCDLIVNKIKDQSTEEIIGGHWTHLALKNPACYLIATMTKGLRLIDNTELLYSAKLPVSGEAWLNDLIYIKSKDCYLMNLNHKIYKKDIDRKPPTLLLDLKCGNRVGASFKYSEVHDRLIVNMYWKRIGVVDLLHEKVEFTVDLYSGTNITDFRVFGEWEDRVICITADGFIFLMKLNYPQKVGSIADFHNMELIESRKEKGASVAVCKKDRFVFVEIGCQKEPFYCSRIAIFEITSGSLVKKVMVDRFQQEIVGKLALSCYSYIDNYIIWVGLAGGEDGVAQVYSYETTSGVLKELEEKRVSHRELNPVKLNRYNKSFYYIGYRGNLMSLHLNI